MAVTQSRVPHIREFDIALRAGVHEDVALCRMKFGSCDNLSKFFHVSRLDIHDICVSKRPNHKKRERIEYHREQLTETLITDVQIPEVDPEVVCGDVRLLVGINGDGVDVISVCIGVNFPWNGSDDVILMLHAG
jgi:hypothetical protein